MIPHELKHRIDGTVRAVLFVLTLCVSATVFAAGLGFNPGNASAIGQGSSVGPGFAPMQRGAAVVAPVDPYSWVPTSGLRFQGLPGDFVMADATHISQWNDTSGNGYHATAGVSINQPHVVGDACAFIVAEHYLGLPAGALASTGSWTLVLWGKHKSTGAGSTIQMLWSQFGDPGNANVSYFLYPGAFRVAAAGTPLSGYTPPDDIDDELFIIGSNPSGGRYNYNRSQATTDPTFASHAGNGSSWMLGNWSGNLSQDYLNGEIKGVWLYQRELTAPEIQAFKDNLP